MRASDTRSVNDCKKGGKWVALITWHSNRGVCKKEGKRLQVVLVGKMSTSHPWTQNTRTTRGKTATTWDTAGTWSPYRRRSFPLEQESKGDIPKRGWGYVVFTDVTLWVSESPWSRMGDEVRKGKHRAKGDWESWVRDAQRILGLLWGLIWTGIKDLMRAILRGPRQREVARLGLAAGRKREYLRRALFTPADGDLRSEEGQFSYSRWSSGLPLYPQVGMVIKIFSRELILKPQTYQWKTTAQK